MRAGGAQAPLPRNSIRGQGEEGGGERGKEEEEERGRGRSPLGARAGSATVCPNPQHC